MSTIDESKHEDRVYLRRAIEIGVRLVILTTLVVWSIWIIRPFLMPVIWGAIIAVSIFPIFRRAKAGMGERGKTTAVLFTLLALALLLVPTYLLAESVVTATTTFARDVVDGTLKVPPPPDEVATWPVVGEPLHAAWALASQNLEATLRHLAPHLKSFGAAALSTAGGLLIEVLQFCLAFIVAGVFLATAEGSGRAALALGNRLAGERGIELTNLTTATIRSVAQGVIGVAVIQSLLALAGMLVVGVPSAAVWALAILILAVIQLPPLLVLLPVTIYVFSHASTVGAVIFAVWALLVSVSDSFLKPLLMGRGVDVPMLVILLGALGGMVAAGIIGLFVGAVVLALTYQLFMAWLRRDPDAAEAPVDD